MQTLKRIVAPTVLLAAAFLTLGLVELVLANDPSWLVLGIVLFIIGCVIEPPKSATSRTQLELRNFRGQGLERRG